MPKPATLTIQLDEPLTAAEQHTLEQERTLIDLFAAIELVILTRHVGLTVPREGE